MERLEFLKTLSAAIAPSGREGAVAALIEKELAPLCDEIYTDRGGNLIAKIKPENEEAPKKIMISAHMDEVGFMVKTIDGDGRIRITPLGKYDSRVLSGRKVSFIKPISGLVASKAIHQQSRVERGAPVPLDKIYIEIGARDKAAAEEHLSIGDFGTFAPKFTRLGKDLLAGKALGGRVGVLLLCELAKEIKAKKDAGALHAEYDLVFSAKREIGRMEYAIATAAYTLAPDRAIVIDSIPTADFVDATQVKCGGGVVLVPADSATVYNRRDYAFAVDACEKKEIKHQFYRSDVRLGNEAGTVHKSREGIPTTAIGLAVRNLHSGAEIVSLADMDAAAALLSACLEM